MGDEEQAPLLAVFKDFFQKGTGSDVVQILQGLVQDDDGLVLQLHAGKGKTLPLPGGKILGIGRQKGIEPLG